jgi:hypothetical protein
MGRKGKNVRKAKRERPFSSASIKGSNTHPGPSLSVQELVRDRNTPFNKGGLKPSGGSNKNHNKGG